MNTILPRGLIPQERRHRRRRPTPPLKTDNLTARGIIHYNPHLTMKEVEKFWILSAIERTEGSITEACRMLGMSRETVYRKVRKYRSEP